MYNFLAIIPARFASSRFPGKPLADIGGKPMIQRVYERVKVSTDSLLVATDDQRIVNVVESFGGNVVITSASHRSGTDRCAEALNLWEQSTSKNFDVVINVQGDEPFIRTDQIELVKNCFNDSETQIATLVKVIEENEIIVDPNRPKVVLDSKSFALYFSRAPIPWLREYPREQWAKAHNFYQHIGLYAYRCNVLRELTRLQPSKLEIAESLEQLRWLENGYKIKTAITQFESYGIDTEEDLKRVLKLGLL